MRKVFKKFKNCIRAPSCCRHHFETLHKLNNINSKLINTNCDVEKELTNQLVNQRGIFTPSKISKMILEMNGTSPGIIYDAISNDAFKYSISKFLDDSVNTASSVKGMDSRTITRRSSDWVAVIRGPNRTIRCFDISKLRKFQNPWFKLWRFQHWDDSEEATGYCSVNYHSFQII